MPEVTNRLRVELVLVALQVTELGELFVARVQLAGKRLGRGVNNLVCAHVTPLRKRLVTDVALIRPLSSVSSLVCLEVTQLRKPLTTSGLAAYKWLDACVGACVDLQMCLLVERLVTIRHGTSVALSLFGGT